MEGRMGFLDKLLGRSKKAAGDHFDNPSLRREGVTQEREAMAEDRSLDVEEPRHSPRKSLSGARLRANPIPGRSGTHSRLDSRVWAKLLLCPLISQ